MREVCAELRMTSNSLFFVCVLVTTRTHKHARTLPIFIIVWLHLREPIATQSIVDIDWPCDRPGVVHLWYALEAAQDCASTIASFYIRLTAQ